MSGVENELCDQEGCGAPAAVAIAVARVKGGEVFLCATCHEEARPTMEASKTKWEALIEAGAHERIASRIIKVETSRARRQDAALDLLLEQLLDEEEAGL